jgi:hypothetical protein
MAAENSSVLSHLFQQHQIYNHRAHDQEESRCDATHSMRAMTRAAAAFDAGQIHSIKPNSAIFVRRSRNVEIDNNTTARGKVAKTAIAVDATCDRASVRVGNNRLT